MGLSSNGTEGSVEDSLSLCLSTVPEMYFRKNFSMSHPATFSAVTAQPFSNAGSSSLSGHVVQEQLSNYLDLVEVCLWRQISSRADDIFSALMQLQVRKVVTTVRPSVRPNQCCIVFCKSRSSSSVFVHCMRKKSVFT